MSTENDVPLVEALLQLLAPARFVLPERALREGALVLQSVLQLELPRAKLLALPPERLVVRQRLRDKYSSM